jgi:Flp pilus assembly protein TadG
MRAKENERGSVLVFITLMIVLLLVMVGFGLDTGQLTYVRNQGQAAVDSAALAAVSALPSRNAAQVEGRAAAFNSINNYVESPTNKIGSANVSYVTYDFASNNITSYTATVANANGVRVALETASGDSAITTPVFLTPLMNLFGSKTSGTQNVSVSAVAVITETPSIPITLWQGACPATDGDEATGVKIQMQHPDQKADGNENACWTTFYDCSSGSPDIKAGFTAGADCSGSGLTAGVSIGSMICQNRGQVNTVMQSAEDFFFTAPNKDRWWLIPVIGGGANCDPNNPTKVVKWAKIYPTGIVRTGNPKYLTANVVCGMNLDRELNSSVCFSHKLVREKAKNM